MLVYSIGMFRFPSFSFDEPDLGDDLSRDPVDEIIPGGPGDDPRVDTTAPTISNAEVRFSPSSINSGQTSTATVTCTAVDLGDGVSSVSVVEPNGTTHTMTRTSGNASVGTYSKSFSYPWSSSYASQNRSQTFRITAKDLRNNTSPQSTVTGTLSYGAVPDTTGPSLSSASASVSPSSIGSGSTATLTASINASDSAGISSVTANGQQMINTSGNTWSTTFSYPWSSSYASTNRSLSVSFVATDNIGNTSSSSASTTLTYQAVPDTTSPSVGSPSASPSSLSFNDSSSSSQNVTISATVTDNRSSASNITVYFNGNATSSSNSTFSRTFSVSKPSSLGTSYFSCSIYARDAAGNQSTTRSISVPIYRTDSTNPSITFNNPGNKSFSLAGSNSLRVYYSVVATDPSPSSGISSVTISGATQYSSSGSNYYFYEDFLRGNYGFSNSPVTRTATVTDGAGRTKSASQTFNIKINDDVDPTLGTLNHNGTISIYTSNGTGSSNTVRQYYNITATDTGRGVSGAPSIPGATHSHTSGTTYYYYEDFAYPNYSFSNTTVTRTATVTDHAGNSASKSSSFSVRRVDNSDPSITFYSVGDQEFTTNGSSTISVSYRVNVSDVGQGVSSVSIPGATRTSGRGSGNWYFTESF